MAKKIKLGVIGMSEGNGHPYSWSAIFNGFDLEAMQDCGYPVIPQYLSAQNYPQDFLGDLGHVEAVFTQDRAVSEHLAKAAKIPVVCTSVNELLQNVDAVLLARDDAKNRLEQVEEILKSGKPVFIDKPVAINLKVWNQLLEWQQHSGQIFTCSSLRFSNQLQLSAEQKKTLGEVEFIEASIPKYWETYAVHLIEPSYTMLNDWSPIKDVIQLRNEPIKTVEVVKDSGIVYRFNVTGAVGSDLSFRLHGSKGFVELKWSDAFQCFRESLLQFVQLLNQGDVAIPREHTRQIVETIEKGML